MNTDNFSEVHTWFEKSGIISNIRTHLRQNLVNALKNKTSALEINKDFKAAKQYIYDMLIAEYLLNYNYTYTLSVFASEVPLLINLQQQSTKIHTHGVEKYCINKLPNDYVCHTLQTIGINPNNLMGQNILSQYATSEGPLILCILRCFVSFFSSAPNSDSNKICTYNKQTQTDFSKLSKSRESIRISEAKKNLYQQKDLFNTQLKKKECELREQAILIERQLVSLNEKLSHAQNLMYLVDAKENDLAKEKIKNEQLLASRELELSQKEKILSQETDRLRKELNINRTFEDDMKKLQQELIKVKNELPLTSQNLTIVKRDICVQTDISDNSIVEEVNLLKEEKQELSNLIREQQLRIEELTMRAVTLSRQLEEAQLFTTSNIKPASSITKNCNVNTIFSESSSTEDILQDAKMRLKRLEEESLKADQYFYNYITTSP